MLQRQLLLLLWVAGCASARLIVPEEDWQTVPSAQRTSIDRRHEADLAAARTELTSASAELAAYWRAHPAPAAPPPLATLATRPSPTSDAWDNAVHDHEQARRAAFARVEADKASWLRADLAWRELRGETASARLEMVICEREMVRARTIDRNLLGTESYDSAPVRGQFSRAQQRWYALSDRANQTRDAFERAGAVLASAKEAYAEIMRNGPAPLRGPPAFADARPARLELTAWAVLRSDIRRRGGLRHYLDTAAIATAGLRRAKLQLAARSVVPHRRSPDVAVNDQGNHQYIAAPPTAAPPTTAPLAPAPRKLAPAPTPPARTATAAPLAPATSKPAPAATRTAIAAPLPPRPSKPIAQLPSSAAKAATAVPLAPAPSKPAAPHPDAASPMFPAPSNQSTPTSTAKPVEPADTASR